MRLLASSLAWSWGLFLAGATYAQSLNSELSFGHGSRIAADQSQTIPHFTLLGSPYPPEVLSNKVVLTPGAPAPGNQRGAVWSERTLEHQQWTLDVSFRVSGPERGGGNLNVWLAEDGPRAVGTDSVYSVARFKGLVLVLDAAGGTGSTGALRAYLNDGSKDFKAQAGVDGLAFAHCAFAYRNLGQPSQIQVRQTDRSFRVTIDGQPCLASDDIALPTGFHVGITAASADVPDAAEIFQLLVKNDGGQEQQQPPETRAAAAAAEPPIPDADAEAITTTKAQFADLHNRLQNMQHQLAALLRQASAASQAGETRHAEVSAMLADEELRGGGGAATAATAAKLDRVLARLDRLDRIDERLNRLEHVDERIERMERGLKALQADLQQAVANAEKNLVRRLSGHLQGHHDRLADVLKPTGHGRLILVIVGGQLLLVLAFVAYKRRKNSSSKKFL